MLVEPIESLSIRLTATDQETKTSGDPSVDVNPVTLKPLHGDLTQERYYGEPNNFKYENYNATIDWNPCPVSLLWTTSYSVLNSDQINDVTSAVLIPPSTTLGEFLAANFGAPLGGTEDNNAGMEKFTQEIRLASPVSDRLEWQIGGYYTHEAGLLDQHLNALTLAGASAGLPALEIITLASTYKEYAGFGDVTYHFNPQFDVQVGGRWSTNKQTAAESISGPSGRQHRLQHALQGECLHLFGRAALAHRREYRRWFMHARGHRLPPGWSQHVAAGSPSGRRCRGSTARTPRVNVELGIRSTQLDGHLSIDVAALLCATGRTFSSSKYVDASFGM